MSRCAAARVVAAEARSRPAGACCSPCRPDSFSWESATGENCRRRARILAFLEHAQGLDGARQLRSVALESANAPVLVHHGSADAIGERLEVHHGDVQGLEGRLALDAALSHHLQFEAHVFREDCAAPVLQSLEVRLELVEAVGHDAPV